MHAMNSADLVYVCIIQASDADEGVFAELRYSLSGFGTGDRYVTYELNRPIK